MSEEVEHIGSLLLEEGLVTRRDLERAAAVQAESGLPLTRVLVEEHIVAEGDIVRILARRSGLEYVNLAESTIDPAAAAPYRQLGLLYYDEKDVARAAEAFRRYLALRPDAPDAPRIAEYLATLER